MASSSKYLLGPPVSSLRVFPLDWPRSFTPVIKSSAKSESEQRPLLHKTPTTSASVSTEAHTDNHVSTSHRPPIGSRTSHNEAADPDLEAGPCGSCKSIISIRHRQYIQHQAISILYYGTIALQIIIGLSFATPFSLASSRPLRTMVLGLLIAFTALILAFLRWKERSIDEQDHMRTNTVQEDMAEETEERHMLARKGSWLRLHE